MADTPTLELRIQDNSEKAIQGLQSLASSLTSLKGTLAGGLGLEKIINEMETLHNKFSAVFSPETVSNIDKTANALERIAKASTAKLPSLGKGTGGSGMPEDFGIGNAADEVGAATEELQDKLGDLNTELQLPGMSSLENKLEASNGEIGGMTQKISGANEELTTANNELKNIKENAVGASNGFGNLGKGINRVISPLDKLIKAFNRILFYRVIRSVIKEISKGFSEGIANVREYSKAINGSFNTAMTNAENALFKMKNSLGAALAPAIEALVPVLQTVVSWFITMVNYANQFIALLTGKSQWTRATDASASSLDKVKSSASGAAKQVKNLLADFDELNIIQSESGGSGGGSGGAAAIDYTNAFEEVYTFDGKIKEISEWIQRHGPLIEDIVKSIAIAFGAWRISKVLPEELASVFKIAVGLYIAWVGVQHAYKAFTDQWKNGVDLDNMSELLGGVLLVTLGLGIAFGSAGLGVGLLAGSVVMAITPLKELIETGTLTEASLQQLKIAAILAGAGITLLAKGSIKSAIGMGIAIYGLVEALQDIKGQWDNGVTIENMTSMFRKLSIMVLGAGLAFGTKGIGAAAIVSGVAAMVAPLKELVETGNMSDQAFEQLEYGIGLISAGLTVLTGNWKILLVGGIIAGIAWLVKNWENLPTIWEETVVPWAMQAVADVSKWVQSIWAEFKENNPEIAGMLESFGKSIQDFADSVKAFFEDPVGIAQGWWNTFTEWISGVWETFKEKNPEIAGMIESFGKMLRDFSDGVKAFFNDPGGTIQGWWDSITAELGKEWEWLTGKATELWNKYVYNDPVTGPIIKGIERVVELVKEISNDPNWFGKKWEEVSGRISKKWEEIVACAGELWQSFVKNNPTVALFVGWIEDAIKAFQEFEKDPQGWFDNKKTQIITAINSKVEELRSNLSGIWNSLVESDPTLKKTVDWFIAAFDEIKKFFDDPFGYVSNKWAQVTEALGKWWEDIVTQIDKNVRADKFLGPLIEGIEAAWPKILAFLEDPVSAVQGAWEGLKRWFHNTIVVPLNNFFVDIANGAIETINKIIRGLNSISIDVLGQHIGFNLPEIELLQRMGEENEENAPELPVTLVPTNLSDYMYDPENDVEITFEVDDSALEPPVAAPDLSGVTGAFDEAQAQVHSDVSSILNDASKLERIKFNYRFDTGLNMQFKAGGGFVGTGDLFMAREAGPELVGRIGSRTAVANNDQIVQGVAGGVAAGQSEQNSLLRQQNDLLMQILQKSGKAEAVPSADWGRFIKRSSEMYANNTGT